MLIFWRQRLVILATPKTGTTSLEAALESMADVALLRPAPLKHTPASAFRRHLAPYLEAAAGAPFEAVALIREPFDWLGSWYRARLREVEEEGADGLEPCLENFATFAEAHLAEQPPALADVGSQAAFLDDGGGGCGAHRLFRYDHFDRFTHFLEDRLDCELILPRLNASPRCDLSLPADIEMRLRAIRAPDLALYETAAD